jgi:hypothetical protein
MHSRYDQERHQLARRRRVVRFPLSGDYKHHIISQTRKKNKVLDQRTPCASVHRTLLFRRGGPQPLEQAVHMEDVAAFAPDCAWVTKRENVGDHQRFVRGRVLGGR